MPRKSTHPWDNRNHRQRKPAPPIAGPSDYTMDSYYESAAWRDLRQATLRRDGHACQYCGAVAHQADHVVPRRRGGADALDNLVACCHICNKTAGNHLFISFAAKKAWVLAQRDGTKVEVRERPPTKRRDITPTPRPLTGLRKRLAAKNAPKHEAASVAATVVAQEKALATKFLELHLNSDPFAITLAGNPVCPEPDGSP